MYKQSTYAQMKNIWTDMTILKQHPNFESDTIYCWGT